MVSYERIICFFTSVMDISKLRKKRREARENEGPEDSQARPEEPSEAKEREAESEAAEKPVERPPQEAPQPAEDASTGAEEAAPEVSVEPARAEEAAPRLPAEEEAVAEELVEIVVFKLSEELYGFRVSEVQEVLRPQRITKVPRTVDFIPGVTSVRGKIIPVIDLRKRFHIGAEGTSGASNIIILKGVDRGLIGVLVDRTMDVIRIPESEIMRPPSHLAETEARFIEGVVAQEDKFISIIQPEELLEFNSSEEGS